jgi:flagellar P-ring protein precursor FlgI
MTSTSPFPRRHLVAAAFALCGLALLAAPAAARAQDARIRDLVVEDGSVPVRLMGYGLVVGLPGTGDRPGGGRGSVHTVQSVANLLRRFDVNVPTELLATRNVAAVLVTAELSPFLRPGGRFDVQVASVGDARSLRGGVLYMTPLVSEAGEAAVASAQGALRFGQQRARWGDAESSALAAGAGVLEGDLPRAAGADKAGSRLLLRRPDRVMATRIAEAVNGALGKGVASVEDPGAVALTLAADAEARTTQLAKIAELTLHSARPAMLVLDARDGTVVAGGGLTVGEATVTHGIFTLVVGGAPAAPTDSTSMAVQVRDGASVQQVTAALAAFHLSGDEIGAFLHALADVGALTAEITVR